MAAWTLSREDLDAIGAAYGEQRHAYALDLDRMECLVEWFCAHAQELFYELERSQG